MKAAIIGAALVLFAGGVQAEPAVIASAAYPEGLLWHGG